MDFAQLLAAFQAQQVQLSKLESRLEDFEARFPNATSATATPNPTPLSLPDKTTPTSAHFSDTNNVPTTPPSSPYHLCVDGLKLKWFTVSPHPTFTVKLIHTATGQMVTPLEAFKQDLHLRAINGYDHYDDSILDPDSRCFPFVDGVATISGLRFAKVTSQQGGWFRLEFSCTASVPFTSQRIIIRCNRMKSDAKAETEAELHPDDDICRISGMGKSYSKRWKELGFHCVRDLAKVDMSASTRTARRVLLEKLRKDRGSLTEDRLNKLIALAHRVVRRCTSSEQLAALSDPCDEAKPPLRVPEEAKSSPSPILLPEAADFLASLPAPDTVSVLTTAHSTMTTSFTDVPRDLVVSVDVDKMINFSACDEVLRFDDVLASYPDL